MPIEEETGKTAPSSTVFIRVLQVCESSFHRMKLRSRTVYVEALNAMRRKPDLQDCEKEKIFVFLNSAACKKHMEEVGMAKPV